MNKRTIPFIALGLLLYFCTTVKISAATNLIAGTFIEVNQINQNGKPIQQLSLKNKNSRNVETYEINKYTLLTVDNVPVSIDAFKRGMNIEAEMNGNTVKKLFGYSTQHASDIREEEKVRIGLVTRLNTIGKYITVRLDSYQTETYFYDDYTIVSKGGNITTISTLFEGDRVKLRFNEYNTNKISSIQIIDQGIKIENLYKAEFYTLDPFRKEVTLKNVQMFEDWRWESVNSAQTMTFPYDSSEPIYIGNRKLLSNQLHQLDSFGRNHIYFVTTKQFGREFVEKMVFKNHYERTYYDRMSSINTAINMLGYGNYNYTSYHGGTLLIRNGRLIKDHSLQSVRGQLYLVTDGPTPLKQYANVVYVMNDGLKSPNLTNHQLYFGKISDITNNYGITFSQVKRFNDKWSTTYPMSVFYDNDTDANREFKGNMYDILPEKANLELYKNQYAYAYVTNHRIAGLHILDNESTTEKLVSSGRISSIGRKTISVRNVNRLHTNKWLELGSMNHVDVTQTLMVKDGQTITKQDLTVGDRVYLVHDKNLKAKVIYVY